MLDRPEGWKAHGRATALLGGTAVFWSIAPVAAVFAVDRPKVLVGLGLTMALWILGTLDDVKEMSARLRIIVVAVAGAGLWDAGLGWHLDAPGSTNLILTMLWAVGVVNAVNLLDLMDGVAGSAVAAILFAGGALALHRHDDTAALLGFASAGALCGFLPYNLSQPSRVFLGDGGSMPLGLLCVIVTLGALRGGTTNAGSALALGLLLVGLPLFDMGFRIILRLHRRVSLMTAGPDSLVNRVRDKTSGPLPVAVIAASTQLALSCVAVLACETGKAALLATFCATTVIAIMCAALLQAGARRSSGDPSVTALATSVSSEPPSTEAIAK